MQINLYFIIFTFVGQAAQHWVDIIKRANYWTHKSGISTPSDLLSLGYEIALSVTNQHVYDKPTFSENAIFCLTISNI